MIPDQLDHLTKNILDSLSISDPILLGKGDQAWIFKYKLGVVVKIYKKSSKDYLESLAKLEKIIAQHKLPFTTTEIYEIKEKDGIYFTFEKELTGKTLGKVFPTLSEKDKGKTATQFLGAIDYLSKIILNDNQFGQILLTGENINAITWAEFLDRKLLQRIGLVKEQLGKDVPGLEEKITLMRTVIRNRLGFSQKDLVHGDYFYNNVLFNSNNNLSAMLDFSNSTVVGDFRMDIACGIMYFDLDPVWNKFLVNLAVKKYGKEILPIIQFYTAYQAFYQTESYFYNKGLYKWCLKHLNSKKLWDFMKSN